MVTISQFHYTRSLTAQPFVDALALDGLLDVHLASRSNDREE